LIYFRLMTLFVFLKAGFYSFLLALGLFGLG